jgi:hypothetical protein
MNKFEELREALTGRFASMGLGIHIVYPNTEYTPTIGTPYLRLDILANQPNAVTLGRSGLDEHTGVLQASLFFPKSATDFPVLRMADLIDTALQQFVRGQYLISGATSVRLTSIGIGSTQPEEAWYMQPVNISYRAQVQGLVT